MILECRRQGTIVEGLFRFRDLARVPGRDNLDDIIRAVQAVRAETDAPLRVDANEGWTLESARELVPA